MHETNGVEFATTRLATDETLHYAERGNRGGEAIIFLHGYTDPWFSFSRVNPLLSAEYHAFVLTERGHGDSEISQNAATRWRTSPPSRCVRRASPHA
jgi:pimeloyl-ACP methyl ester carboxylesterase